MLALGENTPSPVPENRPFSYTVWTYSAYQASGGTSENTWAEGWAVSSSVSWAGAPSTSIPRCEQNWSSTSWVTGQYWPSSAKKLLREVT